MSMPSSAIALMASGRTRVASVPAEKASTRPPETWRRRPSAIWLRAELCVQRKRTRGRAAADEGSVCFRMGTLEVETVAAARAVERDGTGELPALQTELAEQRASVPLAQLLGATGAVPPGLLAQVDRDLQ